jgi:hypothetical protein
VNKAVPTAKTKLAQAKLKVVIQTRVRDIEHDDNRLVRVWRDAWQRRERLCAALPSISYAVIPSVLGLVVVPPPESSTRS